MYSLIRALLVCAVAAGFAAGARADDEKKKPAQPTKPEPAKPGQPIIIQLDASKLPPELLKELLKYAGKPGEPTKPGVKPEQPTKPGTKPEQPKPGTKPEATKPGAKPVKAIALSDAIAIAEKTAGGTATRAERTDEDGKVQFKIEVVGAKGEKSKVTLDAGGKVVSGSGKKGDEEEKGEKGKKKGEDDDKDEGKGKKKKDD